MLNNIVRMKKDPNADISSAASKMGKKRWAGLSEEQRKIAMEKARAARQRKLTKTRRLEIARAAAEARWAKARASNSIGETKTAEAGKGQSTSSRRTK